MIPNRWLSESRHVGIVRTRQVGGQISLGLALIGCVRDAQPTARTGLRWARSTDPTARGMCGKSRPKICTAPLDFPPLIDGFVRRFPVSACALERPESTSTHAPRSRTGDQDT